MKGVVRKILIKVVQYRVTLKIISQSADFRALISQLPQGSLAWMSAGIYLAKCSSAISKIAKGESGNGNGERGTGTGNGEREREQERGTGNGNGEFTKRGISKRGNLLTGGISKGGITKTGNL